MVVIVLLAFCLKVPTKRLWRFVGVATCLFFASAAVRNTLTVYEVARLGFVRLGFPVPFSVFIALAFVFLAVAVLRGHEFQSIRPTSLSDIERRQKVESLNHSGATRSTQPKRPSRGAGFLISTLAVMVCGIAFPLGQILCFGLTDYRAPVDAVVVLGAQVYPNGRLSRALASRVDAAVELYQQGYTPVLIMSGGIDTNGTSEAVAMRDYAISHGVPANAIIMDENGYSTEMTARNTVAIAEEYGFTRLAAVSSFYHMPRIKMLFLNVGYDVLTVPANGYKEGLSALRTSLREIPAWWYYWFKMVLTG